MDLYSQALALQNIITSLRSTAATMNLVEQYNILCDVLQVWYDVLVCDRQTHGLDPKNWDKI
jgi:hypothetical protein